MCDLQMLVQVISGLSPMSEKHGVLQTVAFTRRRTTDPLRLYIFCIGSYDLDHTSTHTGFLPVFEPQERQLQRQSSITDRLSVSYLQSFSGQPKMSSFHDLGKSAEETPRQTQGKTFPQPVSSPITETTEGVPRAPERAYTKVPYRSPTAPRAEPSSSTIDKVSAPISSCKDLDTQHAHSSPPTDTAPHLRGGDWVECGSYVLCCLCLCDDCCYAYGSTRQE